MARQPVQLPSRGGANAAGVGNRAQYLRPAKDTQNSRALASAFSKMNRSFGRIAANEQRISNQEMADELRQAEEEQQTLENRALIAGQIDVLTGQDRASAYANNPMALQSHYEGRVQATISEGLLGISTEFQEQDFFGDPQRQSEAQQWLQNEMRTAIGDAPDHLVGSMLPQIQRTGATLLEANDNAVFETAKAQTLTDMSSTSYAHLIGGDSEAFIGAFTLERENAAMDIGKQSANETAVGAFGFILDRAAGSSEGDWRKASDAATDLMKSEFMKGLSAEQQTTMRNHYRAALRNFNSADAERSNRAADAFDAEVGSLQDILQNQLEKNLPLDGILASFVKLDPENGAETYQKQIETFYSRSELYLPSSNANDGVSRGNLQRHIHHLNVNNLQPGTKKFNDYVTTAINEVGMTEADVQKLKAHNTNMDSEVKENPEYAIVKRLFRGLTDAINMALPSDAALSKLALDSTSGFDGSSPYSRMLRESFDTYLSETQGLYPADAEGQKKHIQEAAFKAISDFLEYTSDSDKGTRLIDLIMDPNNEGYFPKRLTTHQAYKSLFEGPGGYLELEAANEAEIKKAKDEAAAIRRDNEAKADEALLPPLPAAEQAGDTPVLSPREKSLQDIDRLLAVTQSLSDEANRMTEPERAAQREAATAAGNQELEDIDLSVEQSRMLEREAAQLQLAIQEDIKAMDAEMAQQQTAIEQAKAAAAEADAVMRQLQASLQLDDIQPPELQSDLPTGGEVTLEALELPQELRTMAVPDQSSITTLEPSARQRASAPNTSDATAIPSMETPDGSPSLQMPSQMSTLAVPETPQATAIPTATREPMGGTASQPDAASIPDLVQPNSTADIILDYVEKSGAKEPKETAKAKTAFDFAKGYLGNTEEDNHKVLSSFIKKVFPNDFNDVRKTAWCAGFVNAVLKAEGTEGTGKLDARSFMEWGVEATDPSEGDVVVLWRVSKDDWRGHVGFFAGYDDAGDIRVLGGNQNDSVSIKSYPKERLLGFRRAE